MFQQPLFQYAMWRMPRTVNFAPGEVGLRSVSPAGQQYGIQRLPTDPIGNFALTLTNVVVGSAIQIETQDGSSTLYNGVAATSSTVINLSAYAAGSPMNDLRIKVRKGTSSPYYRAYETLTTAFVGSQSIYVSQIPDE